MPPPRRGRGVECPYCGEWCDDAEFVDVGVGGGGVQVSPYSCPRCLAVQVGQSALRKGLSDLERKTGWRVGRMPDLTPGELAAVQGGLLKDATLLDYFAAHAPPMPGWYWENAAKDEQGQAADPAPDPLLMEASWRWAFAHAMIGNKSFSVDRVDAVLSKRRVQAP